MFVTSVGISVHIIRKPLVFFFYSTIFFNGNRPRWRSVRSTTKSVHQPRASDFGKCSEVAERIEVVATSLVNFHDFLFFLRVINFCDYVRSKRIFHLLNS